MPLLYTLHHPFPSKSFKKQTWFIFLVYILESKFVAKFAAPPLQDVRFSAGSQELLCSRTGDRLLTRVKVQQCERMLMTS